MILLTDVIYSHLNTATKFYCHLGVEIDWNICKNEIISCSLQKQRPFITILHFNLSLWAKFHQKVLVVLIGAIWSQQFCVYKCPQRPNDWLPILTVITDQQRTYTPSVWLNSDILNHLVSLVSGIKLTFLTLASNSRCRNSQVWNRKTYSIIIQLHKR